MEKNRKDKNKIVVLSEINLIFYLSNKICKLCIFYVNKKYSFT